VSAKLNRAWPASRIPLPQVTTKKTWMVGEAQGASATRTQYKYSMVAPVR
jgi:hypothetical protein